MGEYWKPVNLTKGEYINPHHVGEGLKLPEWDRPTSAVRKLMSARWSPMDDVRAISDYGGQMQLSGRATDAPWPEYERLEEDFIEVRD